MQLLSELMEETGLRRCVLPAAKAPQDDGELTGGGGELGEAGFVAEADRGAQVVLSLGQVRCV